MKTKTMLLGLMLAAATSIVQAQQNDSTTVQRDSVAWDKELGEVTVVAQRQLIKQEIDRIGYDVQADKESKT